MSTKNELIEIAKSLNIEGVDDGWKKSDLMEAIEEAEGKILEPEVEEELPVLKETKEYKLNYGITFKGKVLKDGDPVELTEDQAAPLKEVGAIGPKDELTGIMERRQSLPAGEYPINYGMTRNGIPVAAGSTVYFTADEADTFEKVGLISPKI